jgi:GTP cyclohydrolase I
MSKRAKQAIDPEILEFGEALLRSVDQAMRGEGKVNTPTRVNDAVREWLARQPKTN